MDTREQLMSAIDHIRYWENDFHKSYWDDWYINPGDGYVMFGSYESKKAVLPEAVKLCDATLDTFNTLSDDSLADCLKRMKLQIGIK